MDQADKNAQADMGIEVGRKLFLGKKGKRSLIYERVSVCRKAFEMLWLSVGFK